MGLTLEGVTITLSGAALMNGLTLTIAPGDIVTLMGPSGAGKSTLLSFIAGDLPEVFKATGTVSLDGRDLTGLPPERRGIGRLFQDDLLFPHLTVAENLLFGMPRGDRATRHAAMLRTLTDSGLDGFADRPPHTLSGGQRARVSLMRALAAEPRAMLLDEPFNRLDMALRESFRSFVFAQVRQRAIPCLLVTHDRADAPKGGRVLTLSDGVVRDD